jgi:sugar O-acyltransferase (sialic acid O-acetyltransferase NeuD family)
MDDIVVIGGGGHAKVLVSILRKLHQYRIIGYVDLKDRGLLIGTRYLGGDEILPTLAAERPGLKAVMGVGQVGTGRNRAQIDERMHALGLIFPSIISPHAIVNEEVTIAGAVTAMDGAVINSGALIGKGTILNSNSTVEHDVCLESWVHLAPGCTISGGATVGQYSMIGAGSTVIEGRQITHDCIVGAGAVVIEDLTEPGTYVGCPARRIK